MATNKKKDIDNTIKKYYKKIYELRKEEAKQKSLEYYHANKDRINKKIICECNGTYSVKNKDKHIKTRIHQNYLNKLKKKNKSSDSSDSDSSDSDTSDSDTSDSNTSEEDTPKKITNSKLRARELLAKKLQYNKKTSNKSDHD